MVTEERGHEARPALAERGAILPATDIDPRKPHRRPWTRTQNNKQEASRGRTQAGRNACVPPAARAARTAGAHFCDTNTRLGRGRFGRRLGLRLRLVLRLLLVPVILLLLVLLHLLLLLLNVDTWNSKTKTRRVTGS